MKKFNIQMALLADHKQMSAIARAAYQPYSQEIGSAPAPMTADFSAHIIADTCFILRSEDIICGYAIIIEKSDGYWLENIAIHPSQQGNGFGSGLIRAVEAFISPQADRYQLYTNIVMHKNISWYENLGFIKTKEAEEDGFQRIYFEKKLT